MKAPAMRIFISLDLDQTKDPTVTLYLNRVAMKITSDELDKLMRELNWAQQSIKNIKTNKVVQLYGDGNERKTAKGFSLPWNKLVSTPSIDVQA